MSERRPVRSPLDELADVWQAAWTGSGNGGFSDCCTGDVQYEDPVATEALVGVDELDAHAERVRHALPDLRVESTGERLGTDRFACLPWRMLGTHRGDLANLPSSGRFLTLHGLHYVELADGRIRRARGFYDLYSAGVQLGLLPSRGGLGETALLLLRGFGLRPRA
ncbi:MAG TPA: ester cyclase [Thermoleophilaceae bacterium]|nr:ester cyclase [Thermoleophilaceae bacterium]